MKKVILATLPIFLLTGCSDDLPKCNDSEVTDSLSEIIKDANASGNDEIQRAISSVASDYLIEIKNFNEIGYNEKSQVRLCSANFVTTDGVYNEQYHIKWKNKKKGEFWVEIVQ